MTRQFDIVVLGLSITSSWGNGHATTYRSLIRGLASRGHRVLFLERDMPWYAGNRDEPYPQGATTRLYQSFDELVSLYERTLIQATLVIVGSFVPEGTHVGEWVTAVAKGTTAFYDIDTPVTLSQLAQGGCEYLTPDLIARYHLYLSFTGGPVLRQIERQYGARMARPLYCSVDPELYHPEFHPYRWDLGYLGTYSNDRQPGLHELLLEPARSWFEGRFTVVGPQYPDNLQWPANVEREIHLSPRQHATFYGSQRFTLNITRAAMKAAGYSPSVRLFEAGACAVPVISDWWEGLDSLFAIGKEVLVASNAGDTLRFLRDFPEEVRLAVGNAARQRVLAEHTPERRAAQLEAYWKEADDNFSPHPARRNGQHRKSTAGLDAGGSVECERPAAGGAPGREVVAVADSRGVHESPGAHSGDS